jgi:hypothetical protein
VSGAWKRRPFGRAAAAAVAAPQQLGQDTGGGAAVMKFVCRACDNVAQQQQQSFGVLYLTPTAW